MKTYLHVPFSARGTWRQKKMLIGSVKAIHNLLDSQQSNDRSLPTFRNFSTEKSLASLNRESNR